MKKKKTEETERFCRIEAVKVEKICSFFFIFTERRSLRDKDNRREL